MAARETFIMRVAAMELRRDKTREIMQRITTEFMARLHPIPYDDGGEPDIHPEWAFTAEQVVGRVIDTLTLHQEASFDGQLIDTKRKAAVEHCKALSESLSKIHRPHSSEQSGPDWNLTDAEWEAVRAEGKLAEKNLEDRISIVTKSRDDLDAAFETGLEQLRNRIRRIDALSESGVHLHSRS